MWRIADLPHVEGLSGTVCKLLMLGLRNPYSWVAYASARAIAARASSGEPGSDEERNLLRIELLNILSDPPSGLTQAAALTALALEWWDDPLVVDILNEARGHTEESVRTVALSDALGVLRTAFSYGPDDVSRVTKQITDDEREWLIGRLGALDRMDIDQGLLVAAVSGALRGQHSDLAELVESLKFTSASYGDSELIWPVALNLLADDSRVVDIVCDHIRSEKNSRLILNGNTSGEMLLASAYPLGSPHTDRVAEAIEDRLRKFKKGFRNRELFMLAAVDRGPQMKKALLEHLVTSDVPHWPADALATYFGDDADVRTALYSVLMGDPDRASMIANVATRVLAAGEIIPRLLEILRDVTGTTEPTQGRCDIVAYALIQTCQEQGIGPGRRMESIAAEALRLMPTSPHPLRGDPRHALAAAFYPTTASKTALAGLAELEDRPLELYLREFRHDLDQVRPHLEAASRILRSLPPYLRARVCQSLADRAVAPEVVLHLTQRWADEASDLNKSIASLAHHRALLRAKEEGQIGNEKWQLALAHLGEQASCYGWDHDARRRSAWVGMCVCGDWSMLSGSVETIGESSPVGVSLDDPLHGPDKTLLQQIASRWEALRSEFGDTLLTRLSGNGEEAPTRSAWNSLALVAAQNATLQQGLESAVADDPALLMRAGALVWFVTRGSTSADSVAGALVSYLQNGGYQRENLVGILVAESERIGLEQEELRVRLENALGGVPADEGDPALEALAVLFPDHRWCVTPGKTSPL